MFMGMLILSVSLDCCKNLAHVKRSMFSGHITKAQHMLFDEHVGDDSDDDDDGGRINGQVGPLQLHQSTESSFFFSFTLFYNTVLVLPYINMNPPRVYTCSPS